jgi:DNA-binding transcriptional LysR family regulator
MPLTAEPRITPSRIKTRQLQLLSQIEREGSVLRAAESLGISQPAASRLLGELEDKVGVALFERHARGVSATPAGAILIRRAAAALAEIDRAQAEVAEWQRGGRLPLAIGSLLGPCADYVPRALLALARQAPNVVVTVHVDTSRALIQALMQSQFDLVLARVRDASLQPELVFEPLVEEVFALIVRPGHALARKRRLALADLVDEPWILPPAGTDLRARLDALCVQQGLPLLKSLVETVSAPLTLGLLRLADTVAVLPREFVRPAVAAGTVAELRIELGVRSEPFGLITRRGREPSPQLRSALQAFREAARSTYPAAVPTPAPVAPARRGAHRR